MHMQRLGCSAATKCSNKILVSILSGNTFTQQNCFPMALSFLQAFKTASDPDLSVIEFGWQHAMSN